MAKHVIFVSLVLAALAVATGCKPSKPTESASVPNSIAPSVKAQPVPVPREPPQLTPSHRFKTGIREIAHVKISDDGAIIAVSTDFAAKPTQIEIWSLQPEPKKVREIPGSMIAYSPDGKLIVRNGTKWHDVEVVDAVTGKLACKIEEESDFQAFVSADKIVTVCSTRSDNPRPAFLQVRIYNARTGKVNQDFNIPITSKPIISGPVNNNRDLIFAWEDRLEVYNLETQKLDRKVVLAKTEFKPDLYSLKLSQDGKRIVSSNTVYDGFSGSIMYSFEPKFSDLKNFLHRNKYIRINSSWLSPDFKKNYSGIRIYDIGNSTVVTDLVGAYLDPAVSADGNFMVSRVDRANPELLVWDLTQLPK